jgi:hypothetical protein
VTSTSTTTATAATAATTTTINRFLEAVASGAGVPLDLLADDVILDATVPNWRFTVRGPEAVARQYGKWFDAPAALEELERWPGEGGEVLTYVQSLEQDGVPHAAHHCHLLRFDANGRIARDRFFCGGRWDAARLAEMAAAQQAG